MPLGVNLPEETYEDPAEVAATGRGRWSSWAFKNGLKVSITCHDPPGGDAARG